MIVIRVKVFEVGTNIDTIIGRSLCVKNATGGRTSWFRRNLVGGR